MTLAEFQELCLTILMPLRKGDIYEVDEDTLKQVVRMAYDECRKEAVEAKP